MHWNTEENFDDCFCVFVYYFFLGEIRYIQSKQFRKKELYELIFFMT